MARAFWNPMANMGEIGERAPLTVVRGEGSTVWDDEGNAYLDAIATAMTFVLLVPVLSALANLVATGRDRWDLATRSFGLRFALSGLGLLAAWTALTVLDAVPSVSRFVGLTAGEAGVRHLAVLGVFSSFAFALVYHAYPLMVGRDWYSRTLASVHFWTTHVSVLAGTALLLATGAAQAALASAGGPGTGPSFVVLLRGLTGLALAAFTAAQFVFAYNTIRTSRAGPVVQLSRAATAVGAAS